MVDDSRRRQSSVSIIMPIEDMESVVATVTGYIGIERHNLIKLIDKSGGNYVGYMNESITHLVCWKYEGRKYEIARKLKIKIVNHQWVEDCIKKGKLLPEYPYTLKCGQEVGPLLLNISINNDQSQLELNKSTPKRKTVEGSPRLKKSSGTRYSFEEPLSPQFLSMKLELNRSTPKRNTVEGRPRLKKSSGNGYSFDEPLSPGLLNMKEKRHSTLPESSTKRRKRRLVKKETREIWEITSDSEQSNHRVSDFQEDTAATLNNSDAKRHEPLYDSTCGENRSGKTEFLNDLEPIQDVDGVFNSGQIPHLEGATSSHGKEAVTNVNCMGGVASLPASTGWSCVICMEFSAIRGVLLCGHRFCYACIKTWADRTNASGKDSTCPICKAIFKEIIEVEDAASSNQKTYTQTVPTDDIRRIHIIPDVASTVRSNPHVCLECNCREPADLLISCHICERYSIHHYCLDPPIHPWACSDCRDLRRLLSN